MGTAPIGEKLKESRLRWFGHVLRREPDAVARRGHEMKVDGKRARGRRKLRWNDVVASDMEERGLLKRDAPDRLKWRKKSHTADPAAGRE